MASPFAAASPYDSAIETVIKPGVEDWGKFMELCDRFSANDIKKDEAARALVKSISKSPPNVAVIAATVLDACFNNCGKDFQVACNSPLIMNELSRLLTLRANSPANVCNKIKEAVQNWVADNGQHAYISNIYNTYNSWKKDGHEFPKLNKALPSPPMSSNMSAEAVRAKEEADLAAAIAASLKEEKNKQQQQNEQEKSVYPSLYDDSNNSSQSPKQKETNEKFVKALYSFQVMEEGELAFVVGDIIKLIDDKHADWWKGELNGQTGLFPANYVQRVQKVSKAKAAEVAAQKKNTVVVSVIDELLQKLHMAQTAPTSSDFNADIEKLYERVVGDMKPLIEKDLTGLNKKEEELASLNALYCESVALYDKLVKDSQIAVSTHQMQQPLQQMQQPSMGNYGHVPAYYSSPIPQPQQPPQQQMPPQNSYMYPQ